jgi:hypothetical protein
MKLKVRPLWVRVLLVPVLTWKHRQVPGISWMTAFRCARIILKVKGGR